MKLVPSGQAQVYPPGRSKHRWLQVPLHGLLTASTKMFWLIHSLRSVTWSFSEFSISLLLTLSLTLETTLLVLGAIINFKTKRSFIRAAPTVNMEKKQKTPDVTFLKQHMDVGFFGVSVFEYVRCEYAAHWRWSCISAAGTERSESARARPLAAWFWIRGQTCPVETPRLSPECSSKHGPQIRSHWRGFLHLNKRQNQVYNLNEPQVRNYDHIWMYSTDRTFAD